MTPYANGNYRVLVVDDDPSVLATYCRLLSRAGYRCTKFDDPRRVLEQPDLATNADLILLDYKMPGIDGLTLLAELRRREVTARCILISAYLNESVREQAKHLGVDRILEKPVDVAGFREAVGEVLPVSGPRAARLGA